MILISSDLPEVLHLSNRVYVMYRGRLQAELSGDEITQENVLKHFFDGRLPELAEQNRAPRRRRTRP